MDAATVSPASTGFFSRPAPTGGARLAWSCVAAVLVALVTGLGFAIADTIQASACGDEDVTCALGTFVVGGVVSGTVGVTLAALLLRLGWEWWLICLTVVLAMPSLLDLLGPWAWVVLGLTPALAAAATWTADQSPRWRPGMVASLCLVALAWSVIWTFFPPGS